MYKTGRRISKMADIVLLGVENSTRTNYFTQAARIAGAELSFVPLPSMNPSMNPRVNPRDADFATDPGTAAYFDFDFAALTGKTVKIDPPELDSADILTLDPLMARYREFLARMARTPGIRLLNSCESILCTLDKEQCKRRLAAAAIPVTPLLRGDDDGRIRTIDELRECMATQKLTGAFIKPRFGAGAAGVIAYRRHLKTGEEFIYTSARRSASTLWNTKKIRRITDADEIRGIVNLVLQDGAVIEKWIPKASHGGKVYDLRVVYQFGHIACMVARQSGGPITNLHLNNDALAVHELGLSVELLKEIEDICRRATELFPGLHSAGIDLLLEAGSLRPHIIEINAQGDLIHNDIYNENKIYTDQAAWMVSLSLSSSISA